MEYEVMASSGAGRVSVGRWWWLLGVSALLFVLVYVLAVLTPDGQAFENAALRGADQQKRPSSLPRTKRSAI